MFEVADTPLTGVKLVRSRVQRDHRGTFLKLFHQPLFDIHGLSSRFAEVYISNSYAGVIRGMHFQLPPDAHDKLVYCVGGQALDVVVDLRACSPTFRQFATFDLDEGQGVGVYIPKGCAHGFLARSRTALMLYMVETVYAPAADVGIRWDSIGFDWPVAVPIISERDKAFPAMAEFTTPF